LRRKGHAHGSRRGEKRTVVCFFGLRGLWPMVRHKAVLERYAALRCLWHGVRGLREGSCRKRVGNGLVAPSLVLPIEGFLCGPFSAVWLSVSFVLLLSSHTRDIFSTRSDRFHLDWTAVYTIPSNPRPAVRLLRGRPARRRNTARIFTWMAHGDRLLDLSTSRISCQRHRRAA
jgi:hypothetical protein